MKRALLRISYDVLDDLLNGRWASIGHVQTDTPDDVRVVGVISGMAETGPRGFYVVLESAAFPETRPGEELPELAPFSYWREYHV